MDYEAALQKALTAWFDTERQALTVTYKGAEIPAVAEYGADRDEGAQARTGMAGAVLHVRRADVADPAYRDPVVIGSDTWHVRKVLEGDEHTWKLLIQRDERPVI